ncbi:hypothetical protein PAECIP111893_02986 [Paenibacillus plantiphilus]|uniref:Transmembrane protein n=1 Tax=Paenibacillus plantiphilus TaxID=2905650 RepID=A0ABN8GH20_9BACL|nr:hypothetical protein PAECIP111893_02986 [Paenibacillus plantiphilus]
MNNRPDKVDVLEFTVIIKLESVGFECSGVVNQRRAADMHVPMGVWISAIVIVAILTWMTIWITNKAYSKKWEDHDNEKDGEFR